MATVMNAGIQDVGKAWMGCCIKKYTRALSLMVNQLRRIAITLAGTHKHWVLVRLG